MFENQGQTHDFVSVFFPVLLGVTDTIQSQRCLVPTQPPRSDHDRDWHVSCKYIMCFYSKLK